MAFHLADPGLARAEQQDRELARVHFERGVALYEAGSFDDALAEFQAAYEAQPHPAVLVNIANCYARTNRPVRALQAFERYLRERGAEIDSAERAEIERVMGEQRQLVGEIRIEVTTAVGEVLLDGLPLGRTPTTLTERVAAGPHRIEIRPPDGPPMVRTVTVQGGGLASVTYPPPAAASPAPTEPVAVEPRPSEPVAPAPPPEQPAPPAMAVLSVGGTQGAGVFLDGERVGRIPYEQDVEPGGHRLRVGGDGLLTYEGQLELMPSERTTVTVDLQRGRRPRWVPWVEWSLVGVAGALLAPGIALAATSWGRYLDSEALFDEIDEGRYASQAELDMMWSRYHEVYNEYQSGFDAGWALTGVGIAAALTAITIFILDGVGVLGGRASAEIDIVPVGDEPVAADQGEPGSVE